MQAPPRFDPIKPVRVIGRAFKLVTRLETYKFLSTLPRRLLLADGTEQSDAGGDGHDGHSHVGS